VLRISKLTDYATVILASLATDPARQCTAAEIATRTRIAAPTVSKMLKQLQRAHLVDSARGLHGGYRLARPAADISAAAILDALEGPIALTECAGAHRLCGIAATCNTGTAWQRLNLAIRHSLEEVTLAELAGIDAVAARLAAFDSRLRDGMRRTP
jgi:FeS assembly SUF system regulator